MCNEIILALWSCAGLTWWIIAWRLVASDVRKKKALPASTAGETLSVFKPLPPLGPTGLRLVSAGLESFVRQLDSDSELLLGIHEADRVFTTPFIARLCEQYPQARLEVIFRVEPDDAANPKIAWQRILAAQAEGEWWLWSDADIVAPAGFLQAARQEFAHCKARMMTFPYVVGNVHHQPALLETLFVNVEFYPGVLLLRNLGPVDFGLGAAMLFRRDDFMREIDWDEIGCWLGDDFVLGQRLQPVEIGTTTLQTVPAATTWSNALAHDLRWAKTIRWNRPVGSFARIAIMPVLGWTIAVALHPFDYFTWLGLLGMIQAEVFFAAIICRYAGCRLNLGNMLLTELWIPWRIVLWFLCWLPWPVSWNGKLWRGPRVKSEREIDDQPEQYLPEAVDKHARKSDLFEH